MKIEKVKIDGVFIITPSKYEDERGSFMETFNLKEFREKIGNKKIEFVQDNESVSSFNVLRGMHFQKNDDAQAKLVRVVQGRVFDVVVDLRTDSVTYGDWFGIELSEENNKQLFIPRGCAHGFYVMSEEGAKFQYKCDNYYNKESEGGIMWNDKTVNIEWPFDNNVIVPIISEKDNNYSQLNPNIIELIKEKNEIKSKVGNLTKFILSSEYSNYSKDEQQDLQEQLTILTNYIKILQRRIDRNKI